MLINENTCLVALDVGGTFLKWTIVNLIHIDSAVSRECLRRLPINSEGQAETIIRTFTQVIQVAFEEANARKLAVRGIGVSMPGPFDYEKGISSMQHKFRAIYGVNLRREFTVRLKLRDSFSIRFTPDPWAFLIGEAYFGAVKNCHRLIGITLGTGLGSAFMVNKQIVLGGRGVPPEGALWPLPYKGTTVEDSVSRRAILDRYQALSGRSPENFDVEDLTGLASGGDKISLRVFEELGTTLGKILEPVTSEFKAECVVFGGGISRKFSLFKRPLRRELQVLPHLKKVVPAKLGDLSALYGLAREFIKDRKKT